jgi:hypothetical protein
VECDQIDLGLSRQGNPLRRKAVHRELNCIGWPEQKCITGPESRSKKLGFMHKGLVWSGGAA